MQIQLKELPELLKEKKVFPTKAGQWVSLSENPMIPDSLELEKLFVNKQGVHVIELGDRKAFNKRQQDRGRYSYHRE